MLHFNMQIMKMNTRILIILGIVILTGCSRNDGKRTFEFLKSEREVINDMREEFQKHSFPPPPTPIKLKGLMEYRRADVVQYWNTVIQNSQQMRKVLNETQTKISALDSSGVEDDAINLTKNYEQLLGDTGQAWVELETLGKEELQTEQKQNNSHPILAELIPGIIKSIAAENPAPAVAAFGKVVSNGIQQKNTLNQELQSDVKHLQDALATLQHDGENMVTARSELVTTFNSKFPKYSWNFLLPANQNGH